MAAIIHDMSYLQVHWLVRRGEPGSNFLPDKELDIEAKPQAKTVSYEMLCKTSGSKYVGAARKIIIALQGRAVTVITTMFNIMLPTFCCTRFNILTYYILLDQM